ncbi:MAG: hypothetical protein QHJ73_09410 [Armatimonadota bacterium]|nr:hypothetical protein [Armatimonadota bacterium]
MKMCRWLVWAVWLSAATSGWQGAWADGLRRFDFGTDTSPVAPGYTAVTKDTLYAPGRGYGWVMPPEESARVPAAPAAKPGSIPGLFDRDREVGTELTRDLVMSVRTYHPLVTHTFRLSLPDGEYEAAVLSGDAAYPSGAFRVTAGGATLGALPDRSPGEFALITGRVDVRGGQLDLTFEAEEYWVVNAVLVYPRRMAARVRKEESAFFAASTSQPPGARRDLSGLGLEALKREALPYLVDVCNWILARDLGSNSLKGVNDTRDSIFVNGNLARVLLSAYHLTGDNRYRDEALRWCDTFVSQQHPILTAKGTPGGWWYDMPASRNLYLGDTGTAISPLILAAAQTAGERRERYWDALRRYAALVREGTATDPLNQGRKTCSGWIIGAGKDAGALGCGYYRGHLSTAPYTISTATTGCLAMSQLWAATRQPEYRQIATDAARWLLRIIPEDGRIPYILDGEVNAENWSWSNVTYVGEGLIAVHELVADPVLRTEIAAVMRRTVRLAVAEQGPDGFWGVASSQVGQRSGLVPQLLLWYYRTVARDPQVETSLRRFYAAILTQEGSRRYGVKTLVRPTGFVGLAVADLLRPGITLWQEEGTARPR